MDENLEEMKNFLEIMHKASQQSSRKEILTIAGFVLKHGLKFKPIVLPKRYQDHYGEIKQCYSNSFKLMMEYPEDIIYCEGFAAKIFPVQHAWCMDRHTGELLEPTWKEPGHVYWGVPFKFNYVCNRLFKREFYGSVIDNPEEGWPLLTKKHKQSEWLEKDFKKWTEKQI